MRQQTKQSVFVGAVVAAVIIALGVVASAATGDWGNLVVALVAIAAAMLVLAAISGLIALAARLFPDEHA